MIVHLFVALTLLQAEALRSSTTCQVGKGTLIVMDDTRQSDVAAAGGNEIIAGRALAVHLNGRKAADVRDIDAPSSIMTFADGAMMKVDLRARGKGRQEGTIIQCNSVHESSRETYQTLKVYKGKTLRDQVSIDGGRTLSLYANECNSVIVAQDNLRTNEIALVGHPADLISYRPPIDSPLRGIDIITKHGSELQWQSVLWAERSDP